MRNEQYSLGWNEAIQQRAQLLFREQGCALVAIDLCTTSFTSSRFGLRNNVTNVPRSCCMLYGLYASPIEQEVPWLHQYRQYERWMLVYGYSVRIRQLR